MLMQELTELVLLFFVYAFLGWCIEVIGKLIQYHRFINRGFFTGPICPIYGVGAVLITVSNRLLAPLESGLGTTFVLSFLLCGTLEYVTSYFMEKQFHARWWDYSQKPMNLHGRVWIGNLVLFGLGGVLIIHGINPPLLTFLSRFTFAAQEYIAAALLLLFAADYVMTHFVMKLVKNGIEHSEADNTEAVNREIKLLLSDRNIFYRRFADAYPDVIYRTDRIKARMEEIRAETERIRAEAEQRMATQREQLANAVEPTTMIKTGIIEKQRQLIDLLYQEEEATEEMKALRNQIAEDQARLDSRPLQRLTSTSIYRNPHPQP